MTRITLSPIMDRSAVTQHLGDLQNAFATPAAVVIACNDVEQIGQAGLQLIASARRTAIERGVDLTFEGADGPVRDALRLAGLASFLPASGDPQ